RLRRNNRADLDAGNGSHPVHAGRQAAGRPSIANLIHSLDFYTAFRSFARELSNFVGTTDKVHLPYQSKEKADAIACSMLLVLPGVESPIQGQRAPWVR